MSTVEHHQLADYLGRQRWFTGEGSAATVTRIQPLPWLTDPISGTGVRIELATASAGGREQIYNLPLVYRRDPSPNLEHALIGIATLETGDYLVYDALHDPEAVHVLIAGFGDERAEVGGLEYVRTAEFDVADDAPTVMFSAEQSNTSIIIDDRYMLKFFRRVAPGRNPDVEVLGALSPEYGDAVPTLRGWISTAPTDDLASCDLAILQTFLRTATEGWESARASVRDLLAELDTPPEEMGGDFAGESERLGAATALVHGGMAALLPTSSWDTSDLVALANRLRRRFDDSAVTVPLLLDHKDAVYALYAHVAEISTRVPVQRIHGDLHLGQTLRTSVGWKLIDFEGEPARPLDERTQLDSRLRDVAGMLRSFDYVAHSVLMQVGSDDAGETRAQDWITRNRNAFLDGYGHAIEGDDAVLLRAYEVDKAVYEVVYEAQHRPTWVEIPLRALP